MAFRADLKAQSKRRRERLSSLASAPPQRRRNDVLPPLAVEEVSPADLVSPARNVRRQEAAHIREVAASIAEFGFCDPVLIGSGNTILDGVIRVEAAKHLGLPRIPCIRVQHLTSVEQRHALPPTGWRKRAAGTLRIVGCSTTTNLAQLSIESDARAGAVHTINALRGTVCQVKYKATTKDMQPMKWPEVRRASGISSGVGLAHWTLRPASGRLLANDHKGEKPRFPCR